MEENGSADVSRKIVDKLWTTMNWAIYDGEVSNHEGTPLDSGMENHYMVAEQERVEHDDGPD